MHPPNPFISSLLLPLVFLLAAPSLPVQAEYPTARHAVITAPSPPSSPPPRLPTAIRKMKPDVGEKFYPSYCAFSESGLGGLVDPAAQIAFFARPSVGAARHMDNVTVVGLPPFQRPVAPHRYTHVDWPVGLDGDDDDDDDEPHLLWWRFSRFRRRDHHTHLKARQWACPNGTNSCAGIGYPNTCCTTGEECVTVEDTGLGRVGCCPSGSTCDGTVADCLDGSMACPSSLGGACCIPGYVCEGVGCVPKFAANSTSAAAPPPKTTTIPPATTSTTASAENAGAPLRPTTTGSVAETYCPTGFYACLASAGGGCCQTGRDCATTSCPPLTYTAIVTDHGVTVKVPVTDGPVPTPGSGSCASGWSLCPDDVGPLPGCCPTGYQCDTASCTLVTAGQTATVAKAMPSRASRCANRWATEGMIVVSLFIMVFLLHI